MENAVRPVMQLAVGLVRSPVDPAAEPALSLILQLPENVSLPANVQVAVGETTGSAEFIRCQSGGCLARLPLDETWLGHMAEAAPGTPSTATATFYGQGELAIPFSIDGFAAAKTAFDAR